MAKEYREIVGFEKSGDRLIFRSHCLSCKWGDSAATAWDNRELMKYHLKMYPDHRVLVGQVYVVKQARTRYRVR